MRVIDLSGSQSIVDICLQETGGLGVHCVIDNGGTHIIVWIANSISALAQYEDGGLDRNNAYTHTLSKRGVSFVSLYAENIFMHLRI